MLRSRVRIANADFKILEAGLVRIDGGIVAVVGDVLLLGAALLVVVTAAMQDENDEKNKYILKTYFN